MTARTSVRRSCRVGAAVAGLVVLGGTALTHAAFTDTVHADLGEVGGSYDIALVDRDGTVVQGDPEPLVLDEVVPGPDGSTAVEVGVVTLSEATGPIALSVVNARATPLPADPGREGPGADPFDVGLFTVSVDGEVVAASLTADELSAVVLTGWRPREPRTVQVAVRLPDVLGDPYYAGRAMVLGIQLDGSTS